MTFMCKTKQQRLIICITPTEEWKDLKENAKYASFLKKLLVIFLSSDYRRIKNQTVFCWLGGGALAQGSGKKITMTQFKYLFITVPTLRFGQ